MRVLFLSLLLTFPVAATVPSDRPSPPPGSERRDGYQPPDKEDGDGAPERTGDAGSEYPR